MRLLLSSFHASPEPLDGTHSPPPWRSAVLLFGLAACAPDQELRRNQARDVFWQEEASAADVLFVVDDSISMSDEQSRMGQGFGDFAQALDDSDLDARIAIVTTDMDRSNPHRGRMVGDDPWLSSDDPELRSAFAQRVIVGTEGSDKERGLQAAHHALDADELRQHQGDFVRDEAVLALVFVSDENDCSEDNAFPDESNAQLCADRVEDLVPVQQWIRRFSAIKGPNRRVVASSIVGPAADEGCAGSWPGHRYWTVAEKLDGLVGDICANDYADVLYDLGTRIVGPIRVFHLSAAADPDTLEVWVDDQALPGDPVNGWTHDADYDTLRFDGDYWPPYGSQLVVEYEVEHG